MPPWLLAVDWVELDRELFVLGDLDLDTVTSRPDPLDLLEAAGAGDTEAAVSEDTVTESRLAPSGNAAILASSSCSCCKAFTNAAFNLFVCSALRAFLTLVVTHCSQITLPPPLPENRISLEFHYLFINNQFSNISVIFIRLSLQ